MPKLSIIIPFGTSIQREYIKQRVIEKAINAKLTNVIEYIFVEGYSSSIEEDLPKIIQDNGHQYLKDNEQQECKAFNLGRCRNLGAIYANAPVIMVLDVDYYLSLESLKNLLEFIAIKEIHQNPNAFMILPCVFLSESGSEIVSSLEEDKRDAVIKHDINSGKNHLSKFFTPASSTFVMNRHKYLEIGGNDLEFVGHGYEDFDFMARLLKTCTTFEALPKNLSFDYRNWSFNDFKGFRAWFSLVGYESIFYGIWLYHLWHIEPNQEGYLDNRDKNHQKFYRNLKKFKKLSDGVDCLRDKVALDKRVLCFTSENSSVYTSLRGASVYLGELVCKKEYEFFDEEQFNHTRFLDFLKEYNISCVLFPNAYGNEQRILIYEFVKSQKIPFVVWDRGALMDSWFFDTQGCNYDSPSYLPKYWDKPLSSLEKEQTQEYIEDLLNGQRFLQSQGERLGELSLRRKLGIRHKKVIFVPLQVQNDSVILHFTYPPFSWQGFLEILNRIAKEYEKENVVFCVKKHPLTLEIETSLYDSLLFVPQDTHFMDLLETSCGAVMINSGVGVYAMMSLKPCVLCGNAFYSHQGLNCQVRSEEELKRQIDRILKGDLNVDSEKMLRFVHYLWKEFYSYGESQVTSKIEDNRIREQVAYIDFYKIRIGGVSYLEATSVEKSSFTLKSMAYKPYLYEIKNTKYRNFSIPLLDKVASKVSHTKAFRLTRKLIVRPKDFFLDSKNPLIRRFGVFIK